MSDHLPDSDFFNSLDFSVCEEEQIHAPGCIQPSGVLVAVDRVSGGIAAFSKNAPDLLSESLLGSLGRPWLEVAAGLGLERAADMSKEVPLGPKHVRYPVKVGARAFELYLHTNGVCDLWEFELVEDSDSKVPGVLETWKEALKSPGFHMFRMAQETVEAVAALTAYDRVMFYKFHPDWSGEVIAEARNKTELLPFLGLRYPATDIPSQARQLYRENRLRTISNVHAISEHLEAAAGAPPLDLSHAILRAISPYHIEYLKNMGVGATMVISIMVSGELWGLIACHHLSPKKPSPAVREVCLEMAEVLGQWVEERLAKRRLVSQERTKIEQEHLRRIFGGTDREKLLRSLVFGQHRLELLTGSNAVAVLCGESYAVVGTAPELGWLHAVRRWLLENLAEGEIFSSDKLPDFWPAPEECGGATCGVLAGVVS
ncbi:MAG: GAF domain-containing protein, partial [Verrucomicrobiae bacterium]